MKQSKQALLRRLISPSVEAEEQAAIAVKVLETESSRQLIQVALEKLGDVSNADARPAL